MDKEVIFAVAGSGKTTRIVERLNTENRFMLVTYTDNNRETLRRKIVERFGFFPSNIWLYSYFTFLHRFCYQPFLQLEMRTNGISFNPPPSCTLRLPRTDSRFFVDGYGRLYYSRISCLLEKRNVLSDVVRRLEKYIDVFCVDEVQDFAGYDFEFLMAISAADIHVRFVGDFYQHTFDTSRDGGVNRSLHADYENYRKRFVDVGFIVDTTALSKSYRCSPQVCEFIRDTIGVDIHSHSSGETTVAMVSTQDAADRLHACDETVKLFYQNHHRFGCNSENWGKSKGADHYGDVCVVLSANVYRCLKNAQPLKLAPLTRNKLYVACSRARGDLHLAAPEFFKKFKL